MLTSSDVDQCYAELAVAVQIASSASRPFWGARYAVIADPNSNDLGLMSLVDENLKSGRRLSPWDPDSLQIECKQISKIIDDQRRHERLPEQSCRLGCNSTGTPRRNRESRWSRSFARSLSTAVDQPSLRVVEMEGYPVSFPEGRADYTWLTNKENSGRRSHKNMTK
jgi:hypothetical protein